MMVFRASREKRGPDRFLNLKIAIFTMGAALACAGIIAQRNWLIYVAIGVLAAGVALRFFDRKESSPPPSEN
ncbi:MAG: hypothetical protein ACREMA_14300 [Longimicrobiales bacterium]